MNHWLPSHSKKKADNTTSEAVDEDHRDESKCEEETAGKTHQAVIIRFTRYEYPHRHGDERTAQHTSQQERNGRGWRQVVWIDAPEVVKVSLYELFRDGLGFVLEKMNGLMEGVLSLFLGNTLAP